MKSTKGLILLAIVLFGCLFFAFTRNGDDKENFINQRQKLLSEVGNLLEKQHYSPQIINDAFSKKVFKKYLEELDNDKTLFLQSDINSLKKFETVLDDEIHGADIKFVPAVSAIYDKRIDENITFYKDILDKPFDFKAEESIIIDDEKSDFAKTDAEKKDRLRKKLKFKTLELYSELLAQKEKNKTDTSVQKPDSVLEKESRVKVQKAMDNFFD